MEGSLGGDFCFLSFSPSFGRDQKEFSVQSSTPLNKLPTRNFRRMQGNVKKKDSLMAGFELIRLHLLFDLTDFDLN